MTWVVAIPSYNRAKVVKKKTLATMLKGGVPASKIYIFCANAEEKRVYEAELERGTYKELVVGKLGLNNQREFISSYFPKDTLIVEADDDLRDIFRATSLKSKSSVKDLPAFFENAFKTMKEHKANLWGVYPAPNPYYMYKAKEITTDLTYIPGGMFGYRNTKEKKYDLTLGDAQEDKERTIKYFDADKVVVRFNHISYATTNFAPGGMGQSAERIKAHEVGAKKMEAMYPTYVKAYQKAPTKKLTTGLWDLRFLKVKSGSGRVAPTANRLLRHLEGGKGQQNAPKNIISDEDKKDESITKLDIRNKAKYDEARKNLLEALSKISVPRIPKGRKETGRMNAPTNRGDVLGTDGRTLTMGFGDNRHGWNFFSMNNKYPDVYKALVEFGNQVVPKGWEYQTITLNHNAKAKKHIDKKNVGKSVIVGIGNYSGGELRVFSADSKTHKDLDIHDKPAMFNGGVLPHETQSFSGEGTHGEYKRGLGRYTMIFFKQQRSPEDNKKVGVGAGNNAGIGQPSDPSII